MILNTYDFFFIFGHQYVHVVNVNDKMGYVNMEIMVLMYSSAFERGRVIQVNKGYSSASKGILKA